MISRAREPQNYIWENMGVVQRERNIRKVIVMIIIYFLLYLAYSIQLKMHQANNHFDNFEEINC